MATAHADFKNFITVCSNDEKRLNVWEHVKFFHAFNPSIALSKVVKSGYECLKSTR